MLLEHSMDTQLDPIGPATAERPHGDRDDAVIQIDDLRVRSLSQALRAYAEATAPSLKSAAR
jgi:hypothetical protein